MQTEVNAIYTRKRNKIRCDVCAKRPSAGKGKKENKVNIFDFSPPPPQELRGVFIAARSILILFPYFSQLFHYLHSHFLNFRAKIFFPEIFAIHDPLDIIAAHFKQLTRHTKKETSLNNSHLRQIF